MLRTDFNGEPIELHRIMAKSLYFGLISNVIIPMALLLFCYYLDQNYYMENRVGGFANSLFYIFIVLAATEGAFAFWWRGRQLLLPLVVRKETFQNDIRHGLLRVLRPVFILIASISIYGILYFFLTGRFEETIFMVLLSFIIFQFVRPRYGAINKLIEQQYEMARQGRFYTGDYRPLY